MGSIGVGRGSASGVASLLGALACVLAALALGATPALAAETCPNEKLRAESNTNPTTGKPYSTELKDCRAYEMVSPLYKQGNDARPVVRLNSGLHSNGFPIAPNGETAGFESRGDFAEPEDFHNNPGPENWYTSQRSPSGWTTYPTSPPASSLISDPGLTPFLGGPGLGSVLTADLRSELVSCGQAREKKTEGVEDEYTCAVSTPVPVTGARGPWVLPPAPFFASPNGERVSEAEYLGASSDLSREFVQPERVAWLPSDTATSENLGIYEISGVGTTSPKLRLVNVGKEGKDLTAVDPHSSAVLEGPLFGDKRARTGPESVQGTEYQAISRTGESVFFTADSGVKSTNPAEEKLAVYARVHCPRPGEPGHTSACQEDDENYPPPPNNKSGEWLETVEVSAPSTDCTGSCFSRAGQHAKLSTYQGATYQGASADGSKVFFTTTEPLVAGDGDETADLYEYEFNKAGNRLIQISAGAESGKYADPTPGVGAEVQGVVRTSEDGSHVYFVALGVLTTEPNQLGEAAKEGAPNLYGYDTETGETKFIAKSGEDAGRRVNEEEVGKEESLDENRHAQTTPKGGYLVFDAKNLAGATNSVPEVYLYHFETDTLTLVSHGAGEVKEHEATGVWGFNRQCKEEGRTNCEHENKEAVVAPLPGTFHGGEPDINDWDRAISANGEFVVFSTEEKLQADDVDKAANVYEWHNGEVSMVSDGQDPTGVIKGREAELSGQDWGTISATGSDIFFFTHTRLVGQDTDVLGDLYDARMNRCVGEGKELLGFPASSEQESMACATVGGKVELAGFPKPPVSPGCFGEACQGEPPVSPTFATSTSSLVQAGGNLTPAAGGSLAFKTGTMTKPLTQPQKLAKALKACKAEPKKKRVACESAARRKYPVKKKAIAKKKVMAKKSDRKDT
jgi:hypothetical protein